MTALALPRVPTWQEIDAAADEWGFNCGPAALCAATGLTPDEVRRCLPADWPGYTNPTVMAAALGAAGRAYRVRHRGDHPDPAFVQAALRLPSSRPWFPGISLVRVQWSGPWTLPGVPMRARYRKTHWIATASDHRVYDVNAVSQTTDGWVGSDLWASRLVPWLLRASVPKADGGWWPTHVWEVLGG